MKKTCPFVIFKTFTWATITKTSENSKPEELFATPETFKWRWATITKVSEDFKAVFATTQLSNVECVNGGLG